MIKDYVTSNERIRSRTGSRLATQITVPIVAGIILATLLITTEGIIRCWF